MVIVALLWLTQPAHLRGKDAPSIMAIAFTIKISSWIDRESNEVDIRNYLSTDYKLIQFLPLALVFLLENKINRYFNFNLLHTAMSHGLTVMVAIYFFILNFDKPLESNLDPEAYKVADHEHVMML
jgi:hypothetical protein